MAVLKLKNKVAVITGGSSGIGLAMARRFTAEGAFVFIFGRRQAELQKAIRSIGRNVFSVQGDVSNPDDLTRLYDSVKKRKGVVDIVVANAAYIEMRPTEKVTMEHFEKTFATNAAGTFFTVQKALPLMTRGGSIIAVAATAHIKAAPGRCVYGGSKAAIRSFVRTWAMEFKNRRIRVNTLTPGPTNTPVLKNLFPDDPKAEKAIASFKALIPLGRIGTPEEVASAALFLASDESSYCTGTDLFVDGGLAQV